MTFRIEVRDLFDGHSGLPDENVVHLWQCDLDSLQDREEPRPALSPAERARAARFVFQRDRDRYIAAKLWTRQILSAYLDCPAAELAFTVRPGGKPCLAAGSNRADLRFSLSRCGPIALLAVTAANEVGVDIERLLPASDWPAIARFSLTRDEVAFIHSLPQRKRAIAATETWTRKEAVAKAIGTGLTPEIFAMSVGPAAWETREGMKGVQAWSLSGLPHPAAVAITDNEDRR